MTTNEIRSKIIDAWHKQMKTYGKGPKINYIYCNFDYQYLCKLFFKNKCNGCILTINDTKRGCLEYFETTQRLYVAVQNSLNKYDLGINSISRELIEAMELEYDFFSKGYDILNSLLLEDFFNDIAFVELLKLNRKLMKSDFYKDFMFFAKLEDHNWQSELY